MLQDIHVVVVEDDPFARNWMALVAVRDWRTRLVGEAANPGELLPLLRDPALRVDLVLLDTDIPGGEDWIPRIVETLAPLERSPRILCTGIRPNRTVLRQLDQPFFTGYILKDEIRYSLTWAIALALEGKWVITDGVQALAAAEGLRLRRPCVVLDGRNIIGHLTERQADVARLAFLFSIERRELADELGVGEDWGYQLVSAVYESLGIKDVLSDDQVLDDYFGHYALIRSYIERIKRERGGAVKSKDMETLAFHMMTMPEMRELE
jgi:DNA-binding NarL/FixJ family response regulator